MVRTYSDKLWLCTKSLFFVYKSQTMFLYSDDGSTGFSVRVVELLVPSS